MFLHFVEHVQELFVSLDLRHLMECIFRCLSFEQSVDEEFRRRQEFRLLDWQHRIALFDRLNSNRRRWNLVFLLQTKTHNDVNKTWGNQRNGRCRASASPFFLIKLFSFDRLRNDLWANLVLTMFSVVLNRLLPGNVNVEVYLDVRFLRFDFRSTKLLRNVPEEWKVWCERKRNRTNSWLML